MKSNISKMVIAVIVAVSVIAGTALTNLRPAAACTGGNCGGTIGILSAPLTLSQ
jgi:hypothetical protein